MILIIIVLVMLVILLSMGQVAPMSPNDQPASASGEKRVRFKDVKYERLYVPATGDIIGDRIVSV